MFAKVTGGFDATQIGEATIYLRLDAIVSVSVGEFNGEPRLAVFLSTGRVVYVFGEGVQKLLGYLDHNDRFAPPGDVESVPDIWDRH